MTGTLGIEIVIILLLMIANGFFAATEIAIVSSRRSRLQQQANSGQAGAKQALELAENPERFLATVQIGITLISTLAAAIGGANLSEPLASWFKTFPALVPYASPLSLVIVVLLLTYFSLVIGELVPKRLALQYSERIATALAPFMLGLSVVARPIVTFLTFSSNLIVRLIGQKRAMAPEVTEDDIVYLTHEGIASGTVERGEEELIKRVFQFTDRQVRLVMRPRSEMVAIEAGQTLVEVARLFQTSGYSRLPIYQESLDNILGILYAKDLLSMITERAETDYMKFIRPPLFALEHQHVDDLLTRFRREGVHIAIVVDEYSQVSGLVTIEDLLEELVGEISDEYDAPEDRSIVRREDGSWLVDAMESYDKVQQHLGLPAVPVKERGEYSTLAGMILARLDHIPQEGETLVLDNFKLEVLDMDGRRIDKVLISPLHEEQEEA